MGIKNKKETFDAMLQLLVSNDELRKITEETSKLSEYITADGLIRRRLVKTLGKNIGSKNRYQNKQEFALARLQRTCVRLKERGILVNTMQELLLKLSIESPDHSVLLLPEEDWKDRNIPDEDWYMAIEAVMIRRAPDLVSDEKCKNFTPIISQYKEDLWTYIACISNMRSKKIQQEVVLVESAHRKEQEKETAALKKENDRLCQELSLLKGRLEKSIEKNQELKATIEGIHAETEKKILGNRAELRKTIEGLEQQVLALLKKYDVLRGIHTSDAARVSDGTESEEKLQLPGIDLPEERVLFLGGHENMIKKLRQKHPGWTYIGDDSISKITCDMAFDICFIWYRHLTHRAFQVVQRRLRECGEVIYLNATNLDYLEREMLVGYSSLIKKADTSE